MAPYHWDYRQPDQVGPRRHLCDGRLRPGDLESGTFQEGYREMLFSSRLCAAACLLPGCATAQHLPSRVATSTTLAAPYAEGTTVGRCASPDSMGRTAIIPCPSAVSDVIDLSKKQKSTSPTAVRHDWGLYEVRGSLMFPTLNGQLQTRFAQESLVYDTEQIGPWKDDQVGTSTYEQLTQYCVNRISAPFKGIVVGESSGCAHIAFDIETSAQGANWTLEALAKSGTDWGAPQNFWYLNPKAENPPIDIGCGSNKVAIEIEILPLDDFCTQVVVPLTCPPSLGHL
jgi:hypothetical protein